MRDNSNKTNRESEEILINRYRDDRARIEQQQEENKKQQRLLEEIEEQILYDAKKSHEQLERYADTRDIHLYKAMTAGQNQIYHSQAQAQRSLEQSKDDLVLQSRKLASELEESEKAYKDELRNLDKKIDSDSKK